MNVGYTGQHAARKASSGARSLEGVQRGGCQVACLQMGGCIGQGRKELREALTAGCR